MSSDELSELRADRDRLKIAAERFLLVSDLCDHAYETPENPLNCPGIKETGMWCHWCQLRGAVMGLDYPVAHRSIPDVDPKENQ